MAAGSIRNALGSMRGTAGTVAPPRRLSVPEQLDIFSSMTDDDFVTLRASKGDEAVNQYVSAMTRLARNK
jgi:hypothetical protein